MLLYVPLVGIQTERKGVLYLEPSANLAATVGTITVDFPSPMSNCMTQFQLLRGLLI